MNELRLCKDCKHFIPESDGCRKAPREPEYIYGASRGFYGAQLTRITPTDCGPEARWFEPRESKNG